MDRFKYEHATAAQEHYKKTLLDLHLDAYDCMATQYYISKLDYDNAKPDVRKKRKAELDKTKMLLNSQRMSTESMASVQAKLDNYQLQGRLATVGKRSEVARKQNELALEKHHPTKLLEKFMIASVNPKPSPYHSAHHIVPGKGKTVHANLARVRLHRYGVRINDPDNGVWLPTYKKYTPNWAMPSAKSHLEYHTLKYESWVKDRLQAQINEPSLRRELRFIAKLLKNNQLPLEADRNRK